MTKNLLKAICFFYRHTYHYTRFATRTYEEENLEFSQHLEECHTKVTKHCAIEISNSVYNNTTPSEYCCQKHIATGKACHDDFIKLFLSKLPKDQFGANGDQIWNQCSAIVASAPIASTFSTLS